MADRPLRPATRHCLGEPLPHQQADGPRPHPEAPEPLLISTCVMMRSSGINPGFPGLSRSSGQIGHVLRTRSPLRQTRPYGLRNASLDLHALGAPPAFVLSQDQTLQRQSFDPAGRHEGDGGIRILSCVPTAGTPRGVRLPRRFDPTCRWNRQFGSTFTDDRSPEARPQE